MILYTPAGVSVLIIFLYSAIARFLALMCDLLRACNTAILLMSSFSVLLEKCPNFVKRIRQERQIKISAYDWQGSNISSSLRYPNIFMVLHHHLLCLPIDTTAPILKALMKTIALLPTNRTRAEVLSRVGSGMATAPREVLHQPPYWSK